MHGQQNIKIPLRSSPFRDPEAVWHI